MAVGDAYVFPSFLTPVLTQLFFPKPQTTFFTYFCRGERRKYAGKKSRLNQGSNSQPSGHESDKFTTEPPGRGPFIEGIVVNIGHTHRDGIQTYKWRNRCKWNVHVLQAKLIELLHDHFCESRDFCK